jgi:hypothetical protein
MNGELPPDATAGVITTRAAARAFFSAGTNRAMFRFTLINHMCNDLEQVADVSLPPDRIRQDVSRSPGGDSRVFLNNCVGCHTGMDPMTQAFAYYNYESTLKPALVWWQSTTLTPPLLNPVSLLLMTAGTTIGAREPTGAWAGIAACPDLVPVPKAWAGNSPILMHLPSAR